MFAQKPQNTSLMKTDIHFNQLTDDFHFITDYVQMQAVAIHNNTNWI